MPGGIQGLDRYAYVNNSPVRYTDPSGHRCSPEDECDTPHGDKKPLSLLDFSNEAGAKSFTDGEKHTLEAGAQAVAGALAQETRSQCSRFEERMGECHWMKPKQAFYDVFGGAIKVKRVKEACVDRNGECYASHAGPNSNGQYVIYVYSNATAQEIIDSPFLIVHEIGHAFIWASGQDLPDGNALNDPNGLLSKYSERSDDTYPEIFADMFVHWVYGKWPTDPITMDLTIDGAEKSDYMNNNMPDLIHQAIGW